MKFCPSNDLLLFCSVPGCDRMSFMVWLISHPALDWLALLVALVYLFVVRNFLYWQDKGVPYIPPRPLVGNLLRLLSLDQGPGVFLKGLHQQAIGKSYIGFFIFGRPAMIVRDPALLQRILVKDFHYFTDRHTSSVEHQDPLGAANLFCLKGARWRHVRTTISPTFSSGRLKIMFQHVRHSAAHTREYIQQHDGEAIDTKDLFTRTSLDTVCSCLLGIQSNALQNPKAKLHYYGTKMMHWTPLRALEILAHFFVPDLIEVFRAKLFQRECTSFLAKAFKESICAREISETSGCDFIDIIIQLKKQHQEETNGFDGKFSPSLSENELLAQAMLFFAAGFETTSSTMCFAFYELALNSEIQNLLRTEIKEVLARHNEEMTYEALQEMTYLDMVVAETLRKYPPMAFLDRICLEDYHIPGTEVIIERGTPVFVSLLGLHRDPEFHTNPLVFDPERFSKDRKTDIKPSTYIPFGDGPHSCIGMRFGLLSVKLVLVLVLQRFRVALHNSTPVPLVLSPYVLFLKSVGPLPLVFVSDDLSQQHGHALDSQDSG